MTIDEIMFRLTPWQARKKALTAQYEALRKLTGCDPDCDLMEPIFRIWDAYTVAVSELIGDDCEWLQYFENDCEMGKSPRRVILSNGREIKVKSLRDIARVISYREK